MKKKRSGGYVRCGEGLDALERNNLSSLPGTKPTFHIRQAVAKPINGVTPTLFLRLQNTSCTIMVLS
jgi:hypothetical protein